MTIHRKRTRARSRAVEESTALHRMNPEVTHCYCDAWDLTYPHYHAEHTTEHEAAQRLRARRSEGLA